MDSIPTLMDDLTDENKAYCGSYGTHYQPKPQTENTRALIKVRGREGKTS